MPYKDPEQRRKVWRESQARRRQAGKTTPYDPDKHRLFTARTQGKRSGLHRFIGVDGEGYTDDDGQHHYMALVVGDQVLYKERPLTTRDCLDFLVGFPSRPGIFHVGFFFDYDVTMILRDILTEDPEIMQEIVNPSGDNYRKTIRWDKYKISYIPRKRFTVRLYGDTNNRFVVHDTRAFFQMSFVKALETYGVDGGPVDGDYGQGTYLDMVRAMKSIRSGFKPDIARDIIEYCKVECRMLADLMGVVRDRFAGVKLDASPYEGPGPVAGKVLKAHGFKDSESLLDPGVRDMARRAYYGGRFEIAAHGTIPVPVYEYDLKSAYPWAMTQLPCLKHGVWTAVNHRGMTANKLSGLWCGDVEWDEQIGHGSPSWVNHLNFGPLPFRLPDGRIMFPLSGQGTYWSVEVPPYARVGRAVHYHKTCDCQPFSWVEDMFLERQLMEADRKGSGIALKLVLNSMYGKLAQRVGARPYFNSVWSGLITAYTRERIRNVYDQGNRVVMFATDAVFSLDRINRMHNTDTGLGSWEHAGTYEALTIFQPGVYFDEGTAKFKTRGVPAREIQERASEFIQAANTPAGEVRMQMQNHLGIRQCVAWGPTRYRDLGNWLDAPRTMRVDPTLKRRLIDGQWTVDDRGIQWSHPIPGHPDLVSTPYEQDPDAEIDSATNMWEEGLPDADENVWPGNNVTTKPNTSGGNSGHSNGTE